MSGEMFGETGVLYNTPQPFTFQTTEISQILRMEGSALLRIIHTNTQDGFIIMKNLYMVSKFTILTLGKATLTNMILNNMYNCLFVY